MVSLVSIKCVSNSTSINTEPNFNRSPVNVAEEVVNTNG